MKKIRKVHYDSTYIKEQTTNHGGMKRNKETVVMEMLYIFICMVGTWVYSVKNSLNRKPKICILLYFKYTSLLKKYLTGQISVCNRQLSVTN